MGMRVAVPIGNQRTEVGKDGRPPEDGNMDCVPEALAKRTQALTRRAVTGDELHDAVYGQGYVGLQDPARFVSILAERFGMKLIGPVTGSAQALYGRAVAEIVAGRPVLLSIPSDWNNNPPRSPYAHMVAGCDIGGNGATLTAMNPWTAAYQAESAAWWVERFDRCAYKAIWSMERVEVSEMGVPARWHDDGTTLVAPNRVPTAGWIRQHVIEAMLQWPADLMPVAPLYGIAGGWQQEFAASRSVVCTDRGVVTEKAGPDYRAQLGAANAKIAELEAELAKGGGGANPAYKAAVDALKVALAAEAG